MAMKKFEEWAQQNETMMQTMARKEVGISPLKKIETLLNDVEITDENYKMQAKVILGVIENGLFRQDKGYSPQLIKNFMVELGNLIKTKAGVESRALAK